MSSYSNVIRFTGLSSGMDTQSMVKQLMKAESMKLDKLKKERQMKEWQQVAYREVADALKDFQKTYTRLDLASSTSLLNQKNYDTLVATSESADISAKVTNQDIAADIEFTLLTKAEKDSYKGGAITDGTTASADISALFTGAAELVQPKKADGTIDTASDARGIMIENEYVQIVDDINDGIKVQDFANALKSKGINMKFNSTLGVFTMEGEMGKEIKTMFQGANSSAAADAVFAKLNLTDDGGAKLSPAAKATVGYYGTILPADGNKINIEGVEITLNSSATVNTKYSVDVKTDATKAKELITNFVNAYNKLVDTLHGQTDKKRPRSGSYSYYEPLTDEEKEAMSDKQVEQWEEKAKTGVLYRDTILTNISSQMRTMIYEQVDLDKVPNFKAGTTSKASLALYDIGVATSNEDGYIGKLQIDDAKLTAALESDSNAIMKMFTQTSKAVDNAVPTGDPNKTTADRIAKLNDPRHGVAQRLSTIIDLAVLGPRSGIGKKAGITDDMSEFTNDLYHDLRDINNRIYDMNKRLLEKENSYYAMFSRMENAIAQANSQSSSLMTM